jgi:hypothetical protein
MLVPNLRTRTKEVEILPVSNPRLELDTQQMCKTEYRRALALGICVDGIGLNVGCVLVDEIQDVVPLPRPTRRKSAKPKSAMYRSDTK